MQPIAVAKKNRKKLGHTSQLSRINDFSIGHPPSSLNISQTVLDNDSQSERSTSCKEWHCRTNVVKFSCFWRANRCNQNEEYRVYQIRNSNQLEPQ